MKSPNNIKGARTGLGYSQKEVAERLGMSVGSYYNRESGRIEFTKDEKEELKTMFELTDWEYIEYLYPWLVPVVLRLCEGQ